VEATGQEIIGPRNTRPLPCAFIEAAQAILRTQVGPAAVPYRP
jgi:methylmalonyl-CoA decarboxylase subunit alpha